jgi:hypothetical protein
MVGVWLSGGLCRQVGGVFATSERVNAAIGCAGIYTSMHQRISVGLVLYRTSRTELLHPLDRLAAGRCHVSALALFSTIRRSRRRICIGVLTMGPGDLPGL